MSDRTEISIVRYISHLIDTGLLSKLKKTILRKGKGRKINVNRNYGRSRRRNGIKEDVLRGRNCGYISKAKYYSRYQIIVQNNAIPTPSVTTILDAYSERDFDTESIIDWCCKSSEGLILSEETMEEMELVYAEAIDALTNKDCTKLSTSEEAKLVCRKLYLSTTQTLDGDLKTHNISTKNIENIAIKSDLISDYSFKSEDYDLDSIIEWCTKTSEDIILSEESLIEMEMAYIEAINKLEEEDSDLDSIIEWCTKTSKDIILSEKSLIEMEMAYMEEINIILNKLEEKDSDLDSIIEWCTKTSEAVLLSEESLIEMEIAYIEAINKLREGIDEDGAERSQG